MASQPRVESLMRREFASLERGDRLDLADDVMKLGRIRHLPVTEDGRLVGMVSHRDLLQSSLSLVLEADPERHRSFLRRTRWPCRASKTRTDPR